MTGKKATDTGTKRRDRSPAADRGPRQSKAKGSRPGELLPASRVTDEPEDLQDLRERLHELTTSLEQWCYHSEPERLLRREPPAGTAGEAALSAAKVLRAVVLRWAQHDKDRARDDLARQAADAEKFIDSVRDSRRNERLLGWSRYEKQAALRALLVAVQAMRSKHDVPEEATPSRSAAAGAAKPIVEGIFAALRHHIDITGALAIGLRGGFDDPTKVQQAAEEVSRLLVHADPTKRSSKAILRAVLKHAGIDSRGLFDADRKRRARKGVQ